MEELDTQDFNVYVGADTGIFKGINVSPYGIIKKNLNTLKTLDSGKRIAAVCWGDKSEEEVVIGLRNQTVQVFNTATKTITSSFQAHCGNGPIVSINRLNDLTVTGVTSGTVGVWRNGKCIHKICALSNRGEGLSKVRQSPYEPHVIATGGKENELQLWDLTSHRIPIYQAQNVPRDMLNLRVPVWISDMTFMSDKNCVALCSRHRHVRLYDPRKGTQPVVTFEFEEYPLTSICAVPTNETQVVVGTSHGKMVMLDFRRRKPIHPVCAYKGTIAGAIKEIFVHPKSSLIFSVSLDRFLRIHTQKTHRILHKVYLKSRLNCLLVKSDLEVNDVIPTQKSEVKKKEMGAQEDAEWATMKVIVDNDKKMDIQQSFAESADETDSTNSSSSSEDDT